MTPQPIVKKRKFWLNEPVVRTFGYTLVGTFRTLTFFPFSLTIAPTTVALIVLPPEKQKHP
jgi:hypothetical protein